MVYTIKTGSKFQPIYRTLVQKAEPDEACKQVGDVD